MRGLTKTEREALIAEAHRLREVEHLSRRQIAERLGGGGVVSSSTVGRWLDPEVAKVSASGSLAWKRAHREATATYDAAYVRSGVCSRCGGPMQRAYTGGVCRTCRDRDANARREQIAVLYREGRTLAQIADALGTTTGAIGVEINRMRKQGWNLPRRNSGYPVSARELAEQGVAQR